MDYLLDTNVISYLVEQRESVLSRLRRMNPAYRLHTCAIVEGELLYGIEKAPLARRESLAIDIAETMSDVDVLPVDSASAEAYAKARHYLQSRGRIILDNDIWIAAVAIANDYTLVSHDSAFTRVPGLKLEDWLA